MMSTDGHTAFFSSVAVQQHSQNIVKRPMNSFMLWSRKERKKITDENPRMRSTEISKLLGTKWNALTDEKKRPYLDEAVQLRKAHMKKHPNKPKNKKLQPKEKKLQPIKKFPGLDVMAGPHYPSSYTIHHRPYAGPKPGSLPQLPHGALQPGSRHLWCNEQAAQYSVPYGAVTTPSPVDYSSYSYVPMLEASVAAAAGYYCSGPPSKASPTRMQSSCNPPPVFSGYSSCTQLPPTTYACGGMYNFDTQSAASQCGFDETSFSTTLTPSNASFFNNACTPPTKGGKNLDDSIDSNQEAAELNSKINVYLDHDPAAPATVSGLENGTDHLSSSMPYSEFVSSSPPVFTSSTDSLLDFCEQFVLFD